jgi:hypothetical protein
VYANWKTKEYVDFVNTMYKWNKLGLILPDAANNSEGRNDLVNAGKVMGGFNGLNPGNVDGIELGTGKQFTVFNLTKPFSITGHVSGIATISLLVSLGYWNDWMNGLYYITDDKLFSIQVLLNRMLTDVQFM